MRIRFQEPKNAREASLSILYAILEANEAAQLPHLIQQTTAYLTPIDRSFAIAIIYGTLTRLETIDYVITKQGHKPISKLDPLLRTVLRLSIWQLRWSYQVQAAAVCNEAANLLNKYGHRGQTAYANALLRREAEVPVIINPKNLALTYSLIPELAGLFKKWFGLEEAQRQLDSLLQTPPLIIRVNRYLTTKVELKALLIQEAVEVFDSAFIDDALQIVLGGKSLTALQSFQKGLFFVQGEGAMLPAIIAPRLTKNSKIYDVCAAPGGKITQLAAEYGLGCQYYAQDSLPERLQMIEENVSRLQLPKINLICNDATLAYPPAHLDAFDLVIADVPCSGLGLIGRKPELRFKMTYERILNLVSIQKDILQQAQTLVKSGGHLIYSTCTVNPDENELQVFNFLDSEAGMNFKLTALDSSLPSRLLNKLNSKELENAKSGYLTLLPANHGCEGFFIASLQRVK